MTALEREGALSTLSELERLGMVTPRALIIDDPDFPYEKWEALGEFFGEAKTRLSFYLGDWLNFGSSGVYGERYSQALEATDRAYNTLKNYSYVCRSVARSRRRDELSFSHHEVVASLSPVEQREWLEKAVSGGLSVHDFRAAVRGPAPEKPRQEVLAPDPLSARAIVSAAGALEAAGAVLSDPAAATDARRDEAVRALRDAGETLAAVSRVASLADLARELLALAEPTDDPAIVRVPKENLDRIADVVLDRPSEEGGTNE